MRIFIASTDSRLRLALILLLDHQPGMFVVGISDRLSGLISQVKASDPDVLLLDWDLPVQSIVSLFSNLQILEHPPKTVVLTTDQQKKEALLAAGADYFINKRAPPDELVPILNDIRLSKSEADLS